MAAPLKKDPNKYAKNADIKADTALKTTISVVGMLLMLIGLVGIGLEFFKDGGWLKTAFAWLFESTTRMMSSTNPNESKKSGNIPMYIMIAVGVFYVYKFVTTGGF